MTALEYFRLLAPEYAATIDATVNKWLTMAGNLIVVGCLDAERAAMAQALDRRARGLIAEEGPVLGKDEQRFRQTQAMR